MPDAGANAIRSLPPVENWVNLRSLGLKGDGTTDETAALQKAINEHPVLYIPSGRHYVVRDTLKLRPDSVIIGLHPNETQIDLLDSTPGFQGPGAPRRSSRLRAAAPPSSWASDSTPAASTAAPSAPSGWPAKTRS